MRKLITFLVLVALIGATTAYVVTPSKTPNTKLGNAQGLYSVGTIKAPDLYATDDLLVVDDAQVYDDLIVNGTLTVGVFSSAANVTTGHVTEDLTMDSGVDITAASGAEIFNYGASTGAFTTGTGTNTLSGNTVIPGTKTFMVNGGAATFGAALTAASLVSNTTVVAEDVRSTDDAFVTDDFVVDGAMRVDEASTIASLTINTTLVAEDLRSTDDAFVTDDLVVDGAGRIDETATVNALVVNTTTDINGATTTAGITVDAWSTVTADQYIRRTNTTATNITILDNGADVYLVGNGTGVNTQTIVFPTASANKGRIITVILGTDPLTNSVVLDGEGDEQIDGAGTKTTTDAVGSMYHLICNGVGWIKIASLGTWS